VLPRAYDPSGYSNGHRPRRDRLCHNGTSANDAARANFDPIQNNNIVANPTIVAYRNPFSTDPLFIDFVAALKQMRLRDEAHIRANLTTAADGKWRGRAEGRTRPNVCLVAYIDSIAGFIQTARQLEPGELSDCNAISQVDAPEGVTIDVRVIADKHATTG
jgi:hypothetical protein